MLTLLAKSSIDSFVLLILMVSWINIKVVFFVLLRVKSSFTINTNKSDLFILSVRSIVTIYGLVFHRRASMTWCPTISRVSTLEATVANWCTSLTAISFLDHVGKRKSLVGQLLSHLVSRVFADSRDANCWHLGLDKPCTHLKLFELIDFRTMIWSLWLCT